MRALSRKALLVLICGSLILLLSVGIRATFGLYLRPISESLGWGREVFAFAIALQNIVWGLSQPFLGALADRYGAGRVIAGGGVLYGLGVYLMSTAGTPLMLGVGGGVVMGLALSATSFAVVLGAIGRAVPEQHRAGALGIASAMGSAGQFAMLPLAQGVMTMAGWSLSLLTLAALALVMVPLSTAVAGRPEAPSADLPAQTLGNALSTAGRNGSYWLLFWAFFVCGFHVLFIGVHLPAYIVDRGLPASAGAVALAVVGMANIAGSYLWSMAGGRYSKRLTLSTLYLVRAVAITAFIAVPLTYVSLVAFAAVIGFVWLATVPLTNALVGQMFGLRYVSTLFGVVFLGHQIGAFLGVWMGGVIYDTTGSYQVVWLLAIGLGVLAAVMHLPINERPIVSAPAPAEEGA